MTGPLNDIIEKQKENEWLLCSGLLAISTVHDADDGKLVKDVVCKCAWLEGKNFINQDLGNFWDLTKSGISPLKAANDLRLSAELVRWYFSIPSLFALDDHARVIGEMVYLRSVMEGLTAIARAVEDEDVEGINALVDGLHNGRPAYGVEAKPLLSVDEDFRVALRTKRVVVKTGLGDLDGILGGLYPTELTTLAGRPGVGKTSIATNVALRAADNGGKVLFLSLEMSTTQVWARIACGPVGAMWRDVRAGNVTEEIMQSIENTSRSIAGKYNGIVYIEDSMFSLPEIAQLVARHRPDLVIIDHLDLISRPKGYQASSRGMSSKVEWFGDIIKYLSRFVAKRFSTHVIVIHHMSRAAESRDAKSKRPVLSDLKWSSDIEGYSDIVLMIHRPDMYSDGDDGYVSQPNGVAPVEVWVRKNRQGPVGDCVLLAYDQKKQTFSAGVRETVNLNPDRQKNRVPKDRPEKPIPF